MLSQRVKASLSAPQPSTAWDLSYASFNGGYYGHFFVGTQDATPGGLFFKPDGTKMYVAGPTTDVIFQYDLSTAWDITTASYIQSFSIAGQEAFVRQAVFKPDGTKMYIIGSVTDTVYEYNLSTAWDISTASYLQGFSVSARDTTPFSLFFKSDGTTMYIVGQSSDSVHEFSLSTAWNVTTATWVRAFSVSAQDASPSGLFFKSDGTKMYVLGQAGRDVNEYSLSTAWNISTASFSSNVLIEEQESTPSGLFFKDDGTKMYVIGTNSDSVWSYTLSTAWDTATTSFDKPTSDYFNVFAQETVIQGLFFKPDGTRMYIIGISGDDVNEYSLSTAWQISSATYVQAFSIAAQELNPSGVSFKSDGTKMYIIGTSGDDINEYNLSTAWDVSTSSYLQTYSVATRDSSPNDVYFKPDGTKMYIAGGASTSILEYNLSTAWNVSTSTYVQNYALSRSPSGVYFKPDGTKMYVVNSINDEVVEYSLSTAWNISTSTFSYSFSVADQDPTPTSLFFKDDGTKMYVIGNQYDNVWAFDL